MNVETQRTQLSEEEARQLTSEIKTKAEDLWALLLEAYECGAHVALGYSSWGAYFEAEFGGHASRGYQLLDAGKVVRAIGVHSTIVECPTESQARELSPLRRQDEEEMLDVWNELRAEYGDSLTAKRVRKLVKKRLDRVRREKSARAGCVAHGQLEAQTTVEGAETRSCEIRACDFRELDLPDGCADLILTDPPYGAAYLDLWRDLGVFAGRVLKDGGVLVSYSGQRLLPDCLNLLGENLSYRWVIAAGHRHGSAVVWDRRVQNRWKPILVFSKGEPHYGWLTDAMWLGDGSGKDHHHWGQPVAEAEWIVETFTGLGDLVADPFLGGGTSAVACLRASRMFVGCDVDEEAVRVAGERLRREQCT